MKTEMTDDQMRVAIAEHMGISNVQMRPWYGYFTDGNAINVPDYLNDLNAMHSAEKWLTHSESSKYFEMLQFGTKTTTPASAYAFHATSRQRATAFLRAVGKGEA